MECVSPRQYFIQMIDSIINSNFLTEFEIFSKTSLFFTFSLSFCSIILLKKLLKKKSIISPEGKAVLITGCDSGFGNQLALRLNSLGYRVYATVLSGTSARNLTKKSKMKEQMIVWKMDVTDDEEVKHIYLKVKEDLQTNNCILWSVVNNAGYGLLAQLEWIDLADFKNIFEVNVFGMIRMTKVFLPLLRESKGRVVFLSSILAKETLNGYGAYCMTKYAVRAFARTLRREVDKFGIKVVVLYPGGYKNTNFIESSYKSLDRIWNQLEDNLKNIYGNEEYFQLWKGRQQFAFDHLMSDKTYLVVSDLVDAITNSVPKKEYIPIGWRIGQILASLLPIVPCSFVDYLDSY